MARTHDSYHTATTNGVRLRKYQCPRPAYASTLRRGSPHGRSVRPISLASSRTGLPPRLLYPGIRCTFVVRIFTVWNLNVKGTGSKLPSGTRTVKVNSSQREYQAGPSNTCVVRIFTVGNLRVQGTGSKLPSGTRTVRVNTSQQACQAGPSNTFVVRIFTVWNLNVKGTGSKLPSGTRTVRVNTSQQACQAGQWHPCVPTLHGFGQTSLPLFVSGRAALLVPAVAHGFRVPPSRAGAPRAGENVHGRRLEGLVFAMRHSVRSWSAVACHRFGRAAQVPPPSHLLSHATAIGEDESGGKPPHSKMAFR